ncbi:MAG: AMP-binding protein [Proteobacteria bacterium]|nr:AMP-binding protein [Pseudomonadota bacterium]
MAYDIDDALLDSLNLRRSDGPSGYEIVIPPRSNIARNTVERYAAKRPDHMALIYEGADLSLRTWTFAELDRDASRLAHGLAGLGIGRGDRVALYTGMRPETGIVHMALYKLGAIAVTLSQLYGPDTLAHILNHAEASAIVTQDQAWDRFRGREGEFPTLKHRIVVGAARGDEIPFDGLVAASAGADSFAAVDTDADEVALLMYTSGSTGLPKGIMHGHRILEAYVPSLSLVYNLDRDDPGSVFWSPADWAWVGGLLDLLLIAWRFGRTVVTSEHRFDAEWAFAFMARRGVTHSFMTPTALKRMAQVVEPKKRWPDLKLRVVCTGGEALPGAVLDWAENDLGIVCNEFYGLTEVNHLIGSCKALYPSLPGSMGVAYPGHATTIVDVNGEPLPDDEEGEVVTAGDDATRFLGYWKDPERTADLRLGGWLRTGDMAVRDADGYFWYRGRTDDLIKSSGFRIGPAEVEDCLVRHTAVAEAAVVASPDADRGSIVKAFIRLAEGRSASDALTAELQAHVKQNLAAYKYPREIEYVDSFELTSSGKISRRKLRELEIARKAGSTQQHVSRRRR